MSPKGGYKQTRAKKDPNAPKRPLCGFMCFSNDERANVRLEHPNFGVGEIGKELGRRWAAADPEVREKYNNMANEDKERFVKEKNEYEMAPRITYSGFRARKDPNAPKRNVAAFMWFSNDERAKISAENPGLTVGAIAKELSRRWALADPETKAKYDQMAYEDKQRYEKEKHEWHMKQRQEDMDEMEEEEASSPRMIRMDSSPTYTPNSSSQKWGQPQSSSSSNLGVTQVHPTSPPITINHHPTSPPITINHHHTPPPAVRYGY